MVGRDRLLTAGDVRRLLAAHGLAPRKAHGQNFVVDPNTVRKVVRDAGVVAGERVCEIGPGLGSLTLALRAAGAPVVAVEVDAGLVRALADVVGDDPGVTVVHADALVVDFRTLLGEPVALVANLPYRTATAILLHCLEARAFTRLLVMVQREVGERWVAGAGDAAYGATSVRVAALAEARVAGRVSRQAFYPVPGVDSVTVRLVPRPWVPATDRHAVMALVRRGFAQRRKRLRNALAAPGRPPATVEQALAAAGLPAGARAEELDLDTWVRLAERLERDA